MRLLAARGFVPGAGDERVRRPVAERPAQRQRVAQPPARLDPKAPGALCALEGLQLVAAPHHFGRAGEREQVARLEVDEQHSGAWVDLQVAQRHEEEVAGEVGHEEAALVLHAHEAGTAAAVRHISTALRLPFGRRGVGGHEQRVGTGDDGLRLGVEVFESLDGPWTLVMGLSHPRQLAALDVLRAVAEGLVDVDPEAGLAQRQHMPVHAIAPTRVQLDAQQAQRRTGAQAFGQRVARYRPGGDLEVAGVGRPHEAGRSGQHRRPRPPRPIDRADQHQGQLAVELPVLLGHEPADDLLPALAHALGDTQPLVHGLLAGVERVVFVRVEGVHRKWLLVVRSAKPVT